MPHSAGGWGRVPESITSWRTASRGGSAGEVAFPFDVRWRSCANGRRSRRRGGTLDRACRLWEILLGPHDQADEPVPMLERYQRMRCP
jgi:hypothetical protein